LALLGGLHFEASVSASQAYGAAALALVFNAFVWGLAWWPFRLLDERGLHPLWASCLISAFCGLVVVATRGGSLAAPQGHRAGLLALALACGVINAAFNWGITVGEVVRVVLLFYLMPVWSLIAARLLLKERIQPRGVLQIVVALIGAILVLMKPGPEAQLAEESESPWSVAQESLSTGHDWLASEGGWFGSVGDWLNTPGDWFGSIGDWLNTPGDWFGSNGDCLGLIGGVAFALTNVLLRRHRDAPPASRALAMFAGGAIVPALVALHPLSPVTHLPAGSWHWAGPLLVLALAFLAANLALQFGAARLPARLTALIMLSELVFAVGSAIWLGNETLTIVTVLGASLILAATLWGLLDVRRHSLGSM
jgi:drug/metabolite transporter (DMT)-like permease